MKRGGAAGGLALLAALVFFWPRQAAAMTDQAEGDTSDAPTAADANPEIAIPQDITPQEIPMPQPDANPNANLAAFQYMIRCCEHVYPANVENDACYHIFYSGRAEFNPPELLNQRFYNMTDHPVITGECRKVPLPPDVCRNAGLNSPCYSSAAGAYQIIRPVWDRVRAADPYIGAFDNAGQDEACRRILAECGALDAIAAGDFDTALAKASRIWASLPGSVAGQNPKRLAYATDRFNEGLQLFA